MEVLVRAFTDRFGKYLRSQQLCLKRGILLNFKAVSFKVQRKLMAAKNFCVIIEVKFKKSRFNYQRHFLDACLRLNREKY